jgi:hypothetical protein
MLTRILIFKGTLVALQRNPMKSFAIVILSVAFFAPTLHAQGDAFGSKPSAGQAPAAPTTPAASPTTPPPATSSSPKKVGQGDELTPAAPATSGASPSSIPNAIVTPIKPQYAGPLPKANEIFTRGIAAIGGEAAIRKHTSMVTKGTLSMTAAGMSGKLEIISLAPNKIISIMEFPGVGKITQGFDGTVGWSMNPMQGPSLIEGPMLEELKKSSDMYKDLDPSKIWDKAETKGAVNFGGVPCYEIIVSGGPGDGALYYEIQTGLTRGMVLTVESPMGKMPSTTIMSDYKEFDGVKIATRTDVEAMNMKQVLVVDSVDYKLVDPSIFNLPPEIKALVRGAQSPAAAGAASGAKKPPNRIRVKPAATNGSATSAAPTPNTPAPTTPPTAAPTPPPAIPPASGNP